MTSVHPCRRKRILRRALHGLLVVAALVSKAEAVQVSVQLQGSASAGFLRAAEDRLSEVLTAISEGSLDATSKYFTSDGSQSVDGLLKATGCKPTDVLYQTNLVISPDGGFEVRDIRVEQGVQVPDSEKIQYLVFSLTPQGLISDVRFALESHLYSEVIRKGMNLEDVVVYNKILNFLEVFRTAYNRKDMDYIGKVYSDSALIIIGRVVKNAPKSDDPFAGTSLTGDQIQFVRRSKKQYLELLGRAFQSNASISIDFDNINILRHPLNPSIYGVNLEQAWRSSAYSDHGHLFLMFDFADENRPMIHVRSWQPQAFADGTVIGLGDFIILPKSGPAAGDSAGRPPVGNENR
ncbi:MAG: hypothetical protein NT025_09885 [bacterium]|nr:hypothetical protein [bacterium]